MNLEYTHKPNYYFFAHRLVSFLENEVKKHPALLRDTFNLNEIYDLFEHDFASTSTNLEGIMNIVDEYVIETAYGSQPLISKYRISAENHILELDFNGNAVTELVAGKSIQYPKVA
ncbi:hypothetical protein IAE19_06670 [Acinetobacter sp. S40]|uniref:hypothetical protein n=1 Tax=unclassified Acinetobacter TaxID=196816 RepID=UPI00190E1D96|nr:MULTISPECIES: hypothetical protein [unclassified Acinetobacter]MBJ9985127.1 hypothetical protein [Acinetobacter sp. S40]MBK0063386.1 hypothetical protein [Acinetobacter sp. S55]MBK0066702.1 hypothetical protein [Acinetobacter sp. S54]